MDSEGRHRRDVIAHQASAGVHEDAADRLYADGKDALADRERELGRGDRERAGIAAEREQVRRQRHRSGSGEGGREPDEDRQVGATGDPVESPDDRP